MSATFQIIGAVDGLGADLVVDPDPNGVGSTVDAAGRVVPFLPSEHRTSNTLIAACLDGTSVSARPWAKCTRTGLWIPVADAATVAKASSAVKFDVGPLLNVPLYLQILVNTGNVKRVAWRYA